MADLLKNGLAWLTTQLQAHATEAVTYQRGADSVEVLATFGSTLLKLDNGQGGFTIERTDRDFLIPAASLAISGVKFRPKEDDVITVNDGVEISTFRVLPYADEPVWRWSDPFRTMIRIHTKRTSTEVL